MKTKTQNLTAEATAWATAWAARKLGSTAKTEAGQRRVVGTKLFKILSEHNPYYVDSLEDAYLLALQSTAVAVMEEETKHFACVKRERKTIKKLPVYARSRFAETAEVKKTYQSHAGTNILPRHLEDAIQNLAFDTIFSLPENKRYRKIYYGKNSLVGGHRERSKNRGWDRIVWHYADYSATISPDHRRVWVDYGLGFREYQILTNGSTIIGGRKIRKSDWSSKTILKPHHLRHLYEGAIRGQGIIWRWNRQEKSGAYIQIVSGEVFHTPKIITETAKSVFLSAITAFKKRRDEKIKKQAELKNLENIYVTAADSILAGNCKTQTEQFNNDIDKKYGMHIWAISASALLQLRDDNYTRRAVRQAISHGR